MRSCTRLAAALLCAGALAFRAGSAAACSCSSDAFALLPMQGAVHALDLPLVYYAREADPRLSDALGTAFELNPVLELPGLGLCAHTFSFAVPSPELRSGDEYTFDVNVAREGDPSMLKVVQFRAGRGLAARREIDLSLDVALEEHEPYVSQESFCADRRLNDRLIPRSASVQLWASAPLVLFLSAALNDPVAGRLVDSATTWQFFYGSPDAYEPQTASAQVWLPLPVDSGSCVEVAVFDASGTELHVEELCPEPSAPAHSRVRATAVETRLPAPPVQELEQPDETEQLGRTGCACRARGADLPDGWSALGIALLAAGVARRRVRNHDRDVAAGARRTTP